MLKSYPPKCVHMYIQYFPANIFGDEDFWRCEKGWENILVLDDVDSFYESRQCCCTGQMYTVMSALSSFHHHPGTTS